MSPLPRSAGGAAPPPSDPLAPEFLARVRQLQLRTHRLVNTALTGSYRSVFRGQGIEFEEVRPYEPGDDVRGITSPEAENALLPESAYFVGLGFRAWLGDEGAPVFVGRDPRASSDSIGEAFCRGASALDAGPATTPAMLESLLRGDSKACGACMVTASHLPKEWNGLKLFSAKEQRGLNKKEVKEVLGLAADLADMMEPVAGDIASAELCGNQPVRRVRAGVASMA